MHISRSLNLVQFTAPGRVLGVFGSAVELQSGQIIAVTEGDLDHELETLNKLMVRVQRGDGDLHSERLDRLVEFHVDIPGFPTWHPFGYGPARPLLNLWGIAD